jgi:hypothetical protein
MSNLLRTYVLGFLVMSLFSCKKETITNNQDVFQNEEELLSEFKPEVVGASSSFLSIQWNPVQNSYFKDLSYSVLVNDKKVVDGIKTTKYAVINLAAGHDYKITVVASTQEGKQVQSSLNASTLKEPDPNAQILYKEYNIHNYSMITGRTGIQKLADGGHLIVRSLQHPAYFDNNIFKTIIFRTDRAGNMLWYKLLAAAASITSLSDMLVSVQKSDQEGILLLGNSAIKFSLKDGETLLEKTYETELTGQTFTAIYSISNGSIIAGTQAGNLLSINPQNLNINWHQKNEDRKGEIVVINMDSKQNIYYIFMDNSDQNKLIRVHKCTGTGVLLNAFLFDGKLPNEGSYGYWMTTLLVDSDDNLYMFGRNASFDYLRYFKFNTEGTVLVKNEQSDNFLADRAFFNTSGDIVVAGQRNSGGFNNFSAIYIFDKDLKIKSRRIYNNIEPHLIRGITGNADGSYNLFINYYTTYTYENQNFVFIKSDTDGKI